MEKKIEKINKLLDLTIKSQASDLHISAGHPPIVRIAGELVTLVKEKKIDQEEAQELAFSLMNQEQKDKFLKKKEIDFSCSFQDRARFRVNVFLQRKSIAIALRLVPMEIKTIQELKEFTKIEYFTHHYKIV